jgi:hypothetical protein
VADLKSCGDQANEGVVQHESDGVTRIIVKFEKRGAVNRVFTGDKSVAFFQYYFMGVPPKPSSSPARGNFYCIKRLSRPNFSKLGLTLYIGQKTH